jgi:predicted amino acid-binding ACT domain protein
MSTHFENVYVLNVLSDDHPGIVAAVGKAINQLRGNIDSCSQTVVRGYFTLMMIVSFPKPTDARSLEQAVHAAHPGGSDLQVNARSFLPTAYQNAAKDVSRFVITCTGPDQPGVVLAFSRYLAGKDINIIDLYGDRTGGEFILISEVEIPSRWDIGMLQADLEEMGRGSGFTVRLQHQNIFTATNQLRLSPLG